MLAWPRTTLLSSSFNEIAYILYKQKNAHIHIKFVKSLPDFNYLLSIIHIYIQNDFPI